MYWQKQIYIDSFYDEIKFFFNNFKTLLTSWKNKNIQLNFEIN